MSLTNKNLMKLKNLFPLVFLLILFSSCVETISRPITDNTIAPQFSVEKEILKNRISAIIPAENIHFSSTLTEKSGERSFNTLNVEIIPTTLPSNGISFYKLTDEIQEAVESGISNMEDYQKMKIEVRRTEEEDGVEHHRSYKTEVDL